VIRELERIVDPLFRRVGYQAGPGRMSDSDLYGDDIRLWSERQAALLFRVAAGEAVSEQVDWPHVVEEIEDLGHGDAHPPVQDEIAQLTARLAAAEALVKELRARLRAAWRGGPR
jgi:hypothetical protein